MKTKKKKIAQEIQSRILTIVIAIFMIVSIVVAIMVGNISLSAQKNDLQMQSKAASYLFSGVYDHCRADGVR